MNSTVPAAGAIVFVVAWAIGVCAWFLMLFEAVGVWRFHRWAYRTGVVGLDETRTFPTIVDRLRVNEVFETTNGKFLPTGPTECLFRSHFHMFAFRLSTPFPFKGSIEWSRDQARIRGRLPVFPMVFVGAWVVGWTAGLIGAMVSGADSSADAAMFIVFGLALAGAVVGISLPVEKRRAEALVAEFEAALSAISVR